MKVTLYYPTTFGLYLFPLLSIIQGNTASKDCDPAQAASQILDAIGEFAASGKAKHLSLVKLTIFQASLLKVFQDQLRSKDGSSYTAPRSLFKRGAGKYLFQKTQGKTSNH